MQFKIDENLPIEIAELLIIRDHSGKVLNFSDDEIVIVDQED